ncbi:DNA repair protein RAD5A isoform X2 [Tanacetum coccineum]
MVDEAFDDGRGDTQEYSDLGKLAKHFLKGGKGAMEEGKEIPSKAYIQEVVQELQKGEQGECPICLEAFEDAVLTPCAHRLCRECLLLSWRTHMSGLCPVCRFLFLGNNISFLRLDGTLNQQQREKVIKQFSEDSDILRSSPYKAVGPFLPLVEPEAASLPLVGVGLSTSQPPSYTVKDGIGTHNPWKTDPWWNPAVEEQAVIRIHRIGQTKSVSINHFIVKGTVEQRMEAVQARKQWMISGALTDQEVRSARIEELKMLFT